MTCGITAFRAFREGDAVARAFPSWAMGYANPHSLKKESRERLISIADLKKADSSILAGQSLAEALATSELSEFRGPRQTRTVAGDVLIRRLMQHLLQPFSGHD